MRLVLLILLLAGTVCLWIWLKQSSRPRPARADNSQGLDSSQQPTTLELREAQADKTFWASEMVAEDCGRTFESLWDAVNATTNKLNVLARFSFEQIVLPDWQKVQHLPHGIELHAGGSAGSTLSADQWRASVEELARGGWQLDNIEFRHNRFDTNSTGGPLQSHFYFAARLAHPAKPERAMVEGDLVVDWAQTAGAGEESPAVKRIDGSRLALKTRAGQPFFRPILQETIVTAEKVGYIDPLIVYDFAGIGRPDIILAAKNLRYRNTGPDQYQSEPLCKHPIEFLSSAVIADFDGDGTADLLCANSKGLFLFKGDAQGRFDEPPRQVWQANPRLENTMALTCGDVDEDGSLDVFLGQYKVPTLAQILRPTYYDANDSWPAYLLLNDGHGNFRDATEASGLGPKRWRRTYSASLVDLDGDGHLDLVTVSDFAGLDLYKNDGHGHFTDVTQRWIAEPHGFGMAHALADFNADGRLDLLMIGMPSATVDRLEHLGLWRPYSSEDRQRRSAMTFGNRLYLARPGGGFEQTALSDSIARSGWSWGCSAFDFDNDGFPDVYMANGLQSKESVRDYESEFWLHDIFVGEQMDDQVVSKYFMQQFSRTRGHGWSYGGYEKNRLFLNQRAESFFEIGHLAGVSLEEDSRNVVADDLDGDGRVDLVVTTLEVWPEVKQTLRIFKNGLPDCGHWIGFRFREEGASKSPVGVRVIIRYSGRKAVRQIVTGDSHRSQHAAVVHFGLGEETQVTEAWIHWINGSSLVLRDLAADRFYDISNPLGNSINK